MMAKRSSKKKVLEMFATVLQDKQTKMSKSKKTKTQKVLEDSSESEESAGSTNKNHAMDIEDNVKKNLTDKETTYQKAIESLGTVTETK
jgi:hypothetical protein